MVDFSRMLGCDARPVMFMYTHKTNEIWIASQITGVNRGSLFFVLSFLVYLYVWVSS